MNHQLSEAFHELAEQATTTPISGSPPSHELWQRGRRARRRRLGASVLVVGVAALVFVGALVPIVGDSSRTTPPPATFDESRLAVPDHIWAPSSWARTADEAHPPGPLALIASAPRQKPWLTTTTEEWYGVSAADQTYWWLDLPGRATEEPGVLALSPDGRRVGYFLGGEPTGPRAHSDVTGFAVYDVVTGETYRHSVPTRRGLAPYGIAWGPDSDRLVVSYGQYLTPNSSAFGPTVAWDPYSDHVEVLPMPRSWDGAGMGLGGITVCEMDVEGTVLVVEPATGHTRRLSFSVDDARSVARGAASEVYFNPSGTAAVMKGDLPLGEGASTSGLHAAVVKGRRLVEPRLLGVNWQLNRILGWVDDERVLTEAHPRNGYGLRYITYDVRTGAVDPAIRHTDPPGRGLQASFAQDLLRRPFVAGKAPPRPWHPWWGWAVVPCGLLAGLVLSFARRSVRWWRDEQRLLRESDR
ncbi:MAG TPA: hypothetical protein VF165_06795 [Nocardioidaceae bacterium]